MYTTITEEKRNSERTTSQGLFEAAVTRDSSVRESSSREREQALLTLFNKKGGSAAVDNYPLGSQGTKSSPCDTYFEPFDRLKVETAKPQRPSKAYADSSVFVPPYEARRAENEFKYFSGRVAVDRPAVKSKKEIRPSNITLGYSETDKDKKVTRLELTKRDIMTIVLYASVIIFLFAMVVATGVTVNNLKKNVAELERGVESARVLNEQLYDEYVLVNNELVLKGKAVELGMVADSDEVYLTLIPVVDPVEYRPMTNWFDQLCDFLAGLFG